MEARRRDASAVYNILEHGPPKDSDVFTVSPPPSFRATHARGLLAKRKVRHCCIIESAPAPFNVGSVQRLQREHPSVDATKRTCG